MRSVYRRFKAVLFNTAIAMSVGFFSMGGTGVYGATPFSTPKSCGYVGAASACPYAPALIGPWHYVPSSPFYLLTGDPVLYSEAETTAWFTGRETAGGLCDITQTGSSYSPYTYGLGNILVVQSFEIDYTYVNICPGGPPNPTRETGNVQRPMSCPLGNMTATTSPATGPYCAPWSTPSEAPLKAAGPSCPNCGPADAGTAQTTAGNPVNVSNGNKVQVENDYSGPGPNGLLFTRTYNSVVAYGLCGSFTDADVGSIVMGEAWAATYFQKLMPTTITDSRGTFNAVYAYRPDGRLLIFNLYNGVYTPDADVSDSLSKTASGWQYQTASDTIETYDSNGRLLSIAKRGQGPQTLTYPPGSLYPEPPSSVSDPFGHTLTFAYLYDANGVQRLASITDPAGKTVTYTYDSYSNLASATSTDGTVRIYSYSYWQSCHFLSSLTDESNVVYATWTYNGSNVVASSQHAGGVDLYSFTYGTYGTGGSVNVTDPLGTTRTYTQSLVWGVYRTTAASSACVGCAEDQSRVLDANGNVTSRLDFNNNETTYAYDVTKNIETSRTEGLTSAGATTPRTRTITTTWNGNFRQPALITLYAGGTATGTPLRTTGFTYDAMGNVLTKTITDTSVTPNVTRIWTNTYDSYGRILTADGPRTDVVDKTTYAYYTCTTGSQCGQLQTVTDANGRVTTYNTYNAHGQPLTITDPNGVVTTLTYDLRMRLTSRQVSTETTTFSYWPTGLLKQVTLPDSSYVLYTYDGAHRLTQINDQLGNKIVYTLDNAGNRIAENSYDASSNLHRTHTRVINALNQLYQDVNAAGTAAVTTTFGYDLNGNQTSIAAPMARNTANAYDELNRLSQITDPASGITKFAYDAADNLTSVVDPRTLTTSYTYTGFGDVKTLASPDTGTTTNTYDSGGNLATSTDARGAVSTYVYDALNRVTSVAYKIGSTTDQTISFTYDAGTNGIGRLTGASDANHSMSWTYDALGRVTGKGQVVGTVTRSVGYGYTNGDLTSLVTPSGQTVVYGYNSNHQVISITINGATLLNGVAYEPFGGVDKWTWGNATVTTRTYDTDQKITQISSQGVRTNAYDNAFRITQIADTTTGASTYTYGYDLLDRVTSGVGAANQTFTYDANGNRLTVGGSASSTYTVSPTSNRVTGISGSQSKSYTYDAAGNPLTYSPISLTYNDRGRLKTVQTTSNTETIVYNALGQMVKVSGGSPGTVLYVYDEAGHLLGEYSSTGALVEETIWLGDIPVATLRPHTGGGIDTYYVHTDHLNTPHQITRPSDNAQMWRWFPPTFGDAQPSLATLSYNLRFPGQIYDAQGGLSQNYHRDYDPAVGRYVESDPIGLKGGINTYGYVAGNPTQRIDPLGLVHWTGTGVTYAAIVGGGGVFGIYNLFSDCLNGKRMFVRVHVSGFAVGFGLAASGTGGQVDLEDPFATADYHSLEGPYKQVWGSIAFGGGYGVGAIQIGDARQVPAWGPIAGIDESVGGTAGRATVVGHSELCCNK